MDHSLFVKTKICLVLLLGLTACSSMQAQMLPPAGLASDAAPAGSAVAPPTFTPQADGAAASPTPSALPAVSAAAPAPATLPVPAYTPEARPAWPTVTPSRNRPVMASDLLYMAGENLLRWDPIANRVEQMAEPVIDFVPAANGQALVYLTRRGVTANGVEPYDVVWLDLPTRRTVTLLAATPLLQQWALSPDGRRLAYMPQVEGDPVYVVSLMAQAGPVQRVAAGTPTPLPPLPEVGAAQRLGACRRQQDGDCDALTWSPASDAVAWSDGDGLWQATLDGAPARLVHPPRVSVTDPKGQTAEMTVHFSHPAYAPQGRFVLLQVQPLHSNIAWHVLVDTRSGQMAQVPDAYRNAPDQVEVVWQPDGSLLVTHASDPMQRMPPWVQMIKVLPTSPDLLAVGKTFDLVSEDFPFNASTRKIIPTHCLSWPGVSERGWMPLTVRLIGADAAPILFHLDWQYGRLQRLLELPADTDAIAWSPDGRGGIVTTRAGAWWYVSPSARMLYDLREALGPQASAFTWLAVSPHP